MLLCLANGAVLYSKRPELLDFAPKTIEWESSKTFFYAEEDNSIKFAVAGVIRPSDKTVWKGAVDWALVAPDSTKMLVRSGGELKLVTMDGSVRVLANVKSLWNGTKDDIGQEFWREEGLQWSADSEMVYLVKDIYEASSQYYSKNATLYRLHLKDGRFEKIIPSFRGYEVYPSVTGQTIYYSRSVGDGGMGFFSYDLNSFKENQLYSTKDKGRSPSPEANHQIFFNLLPYSEEYKAMHSEFAVKRQHAHPSVGLYEKEGRKETCLLAVSGEAGGYIDRPVPLPGGRFLLVDVRASNYNGTLVFDSKTKEYGKFPANTRLYFSVTSKDLVNRYYFNGEGLNVVQRGG